MGVLFKTCRNLIVIVLLSVTCSKAYSTHIMGGNFSVEYVGGYKYKLDLFVECGSISDNLPFNFNIFVYNKLDSSYFTHFAIAQSPVKNQPVLGDSCFSPAGLCIEQLTVSGFVGLANNPDGYYFSWEVCCRNSSVINFNTTDLGSTFYIDFPDAAILNSTPKVTDYPSNGYFCVNECSQIDFGITDKDNDSLVFSLVEPLGSDATSPSNPVNKNSGTGVPNFSYLLPWNSGYSLANYIGGSTPLTIDSTTGVLNACPDLLGLFLIAIKIEEYRGGVKIGETRLELEVQAINCSSTQPPTWEIVSSPSIDSSIVGDTVRVYKTITGGETYCNDMVVTSNNALDTLVLSASSELFNVSYNPYYTAVKDTSGAGGAIKAPFCLQTDCDLVRLEPYKVLYSINHPDECSGLGTSYLEINFIVAPIENDTPIFSLVTMPQADTNFIYRTVKPGEIFCEDIFVTDANLDDTLFLSSSSDWYGNVNFDPYFTTVKDTFGINGQAMVPFCWDVKCDDVSANPYKFLFKVYDSHCPDNDTVYLELNITVELDPNSSPVFALATPPVSDTTFIFKTVTAGETYCQNIIVSDANLTDSLFLNVTSEMISGPTVVSGVSVTGDSVATNGGITNSFCWNVSCDQSDSLPYTILFEVYDNHCTEADTVYLKLNLTVEGQDNPTSLTLLGDSVITTSPGEQISIELVAEDLNLQDSLVIWPASGGWGTSSFSGTGGNVQAEFSWDIGCSDITDGVSPHLIEFYAVDNGCLSDTVLVELEVWVNKEFVFFDTLPNVITPNNDGFNDIFSLNYQADECLDEQFQIEIFDRWGRVVFSSSDIEFEWNGKGNNGDDLSEGVYFFVIDADLSNESVSFKYNLANQITLLR